MNKKYNLNGTAYFYIVFDYRAGLTGSESTQSHGDSTWLSRFGT